jgi:hypothetical protein
LVFSALAVYFIFYLNWDGHVETGCLLNVLFQKKYSKNVLFKKKYSKNILFQKKYSKNILFQKKYSKNVLQYIVNFIINLICNFVYIRVLFLAQPFKKRLYFGPTFSQKVVCILAQPFPKRLYFGPTFSQKVVEKVVVISI